MNSLKGKVAIVTGGGGGIGQAVAYALAAEGAPVVVNDLGADLDGNDADQSVAKTAADSIIAASGIAVYNQDSVASLAGAANIVASALDNFGQLDPRWTHPRKPASPSSTPISGSPTPCAAGSLRSCHGPASTW